jgi:hypothetical protein
MSFLCSLAHLSQKRLRPASARWPSTTLDARAFSKVLYNLTAAWSHLQIDFLMDHVHALLGNDTGFRAASQLTR